MATLLVSVIGHIRGENILWEPILHGMCNPACRLTNYYLPFMHTACFFRLAVERMSLSWLNGTLFRASEACAVGWHDVSCLVSYHNGLRIQTGTCQTGGQLVLLMTCYVSACWPPTCSRPIGQARMKSVDPLGSHLHWRQLLSHKQSILLRCPSSSTFTQT